MSLLLVREFIRTVSMLVHILFRIYNTTQPVAVKVNGVETSNYSYDVKRKCTNIDIPCTDCTTEVKVRVVYSK